ncbi:MAG: glutamine-hydrolyzing GMP synthase, partial [Actinobacteria bacterium]|nr:glutamine-hydrolyzing GMP synthase [Actinomycetota bacterium]
MSGDASPDQVVLVVDFGAQYAQLIARRVREAHVYSEIVPNTITAAEVADRKPAGLIFSGGPASVHVDGAPGIDPGVFDLGVPIFGICYGAQLIARDLGGTVERTGRGEYGRTTLSVRGADGSAGRGGPVDGSTVWMSHFDSISRAPEGFEVTASTPEAPVAAMHDKARRILAVQFHPEVVHTDDGRSVFESFLFDTCGCEPTWSMHSFVDTQVEAIRDRVGDATVICGLSGGVDSSVAAALVHRAIGDQLTCVFVDHGLLRAGEAEQVVDTFRTHQHMRLIDVDASATFLERLAGVTEPEAKRKAIGELFIRTFEEAAAGIAGAKFLVQGTLYPDVIESGTDSAAVIKSHHNVGGLPEDMDFELVEPLRNLFKDEVRALGTELGLPDEIVWRQPFPGPGLAVRIIGEVTAETVAILQEADAIVRAE